MNFNNSDDGEEFSPEQMAYLEKHFKPGEFAVLTILVKTDQLKTFIDVLYDSKLDLAVAGHVAESLPEEMTPMRGNVPGGSSYDN